MATRQSKLVIQHLRRFVFLRDAVGLSDAQLLESFIAHRDEVAFEVLVRRHGAMVMGVCRRVLRSHHDAEDAFQATFLVLARKAAAVSARGLLANWLYGVAYNTARKAKVVAAKRRVREREATDMPEPEATPPNPLHDLHALLDKEVSRLSDKYRAVIVLCDLEGKTRAEAAKQIGCPEGTIASRLAQGRVLLAKRLSRRGMVLSASALAGETSLNIASASVSTSLISTTSNAAILYAAGQAVTGVVSSHVAALAEGVLKAMILTKFKTITVAAVVMGLFAVGGGRVLTWSMASAPIEQQAFAGIAINRADNPEPAAKPAENVHPVVPNKLEEDNAKIALAVQNLKRNLEGIPEFDCRFTASDCSAPTLDDAKRDRDVLRTHSRFVRWIVKKPVERFLVVTNKELLDQPISRLISPAGRLVGQPVEVENGEAKQEVAQQVLNNSLWNGSFLLQVHAGAAGINHIGQSNMFRGWPTSFHPRGGTPLEGSGFFNYMAPENYLLSRGKAVASFKGIQSDGTFQIDFGRAGERPAVKTYLDPDRGFLPVRSSTWRHFGTGEGYDDWYATHFQKIGPDKWWITRSIEDITAYSNRPELKKAGAVFREWKTDRFVAEQKVKDEDLAVTIPGGQTVFAANNPPARIKLDVDRLVHAKDLQELSTELEASAPK